MRPDEENEFDNRDDYSDNEDTAHQFGEADSANFNERQFEETAANEQADRENRPDSNTDTARFNSDEQNAAVNEHEDDENARNANINQQPLTTQGDGEELEENLGGTTNLTLDQLKKEHDPEGRNNA